MSSQLQARSPITDTRPRVLFVDDSRLMRAAALKLLNDQCRVLLAEDGQQGWDMLIADESIQIVFTDLVMPELDGFELLGLIRAASIERIREMPVVVVTDATGSGNAKQKAYEMGATDFIAKPFDATDINARVSSLLRNQVSINPIPEKVLHDPLTGLLNKRGIFNELEIEINFNVQNKQSLVILHIEVDEFKELFIRIGRTNTEKIIDKIANVISSEVDDDGSVARVGLSSFAASLPHTDLEHGLLIARRIGETVSDFRGKLKGRALPVGVSAGICIVDQGASADSAVVLEIAQQARGSAISQGLSQVSSTNLHDYQKKARLHNDHSISIDEVLKELRTGWVTGVEERMGFILNELRPIFTLMTDAEKERFITKV